MRIYVTKKDNRKLHRRKGLGNFPSYYVILVKKLNIIIEQTRYNQSIITYPSNYSNNSTCTFTTPCTTLKNSATLQRAQYKRPIILKYKPIIPLPKKKT